MSNADRPSGARPCGSILSATEYVAGSEIFPGDFVSLASDGKVDSASATSALLGVALGYASADGKRVLVADDPGQKYYIQSDSDDVDAQTDINLNYDIVATAGDSTYDVSRMELDGDSGATTATLPLKLLDIVQSPNNAFGANVECLVKINNHQLGSHTGTAGV